MTEAEKKKMRAKAAKLSRPTPFELPSGSWRCQVVVDGKRITIVDEDPEKAHALAIAAKTGIIEKREERVKQTITLKDAILNYIESRSKVLSPATIRGYHVILDNRFKNLMKMSVKHIDEFEIQKAINGDAEMVSHKTLKNAVGLVVAVLSHYKQINVKTLRYPQKERREHSYLDADQIVKLIFACDGDYAEIPILLGLWLGMRRSEIMGLQWESIDFENSKIHVNHSLVFDKDDQPVIKKAMKTESSNRILDCPGYILGKLDKYQPCIEKRAGTVFKMGINTPYENLERICKREGIPFVGIHGLRHTNASVMLSLGIVDKIAMARGGWATKDTMERVYQHLFASDKQAADNTINNYFNSLISDQKDKLTHGS